MAVDWGKQIFIIQYTAEKKWTFKFVGSFPIKKCGKKHIKLFKKRKLQKKSIIFFSKINIGKYKNRRIHLKYK
jgi:hypothetical protein